MDRTIKKFEEGWPNHRKVALLELMKWEGTVAADVREIIDVTKDYHGAGSLKWVEILANEKIQVLDASTANDLQEPMGFHYHKEEQFFILISGSMTVLVRRGDTIMSEVLDEPFTVRHIPSGADHSVRPGKEVEFFAVCIPPVDAYKKGAAREGTKDGG